MSTPKIGLILSGGGARAAYQAGVLAAISRMLPPGAPSPFRIICGTSAGAINAALLAAHADDFGRGVRQIMATWGSLRASSVHCTDPGVVARTAARWIWAVLSGGGDGPVALLDNTPLRELIDKLVDFRAVRSAIGNGQLDALCVTASSYDSGRSVSFFEGIDSLKPWARARRVGVRATLSAAHVIGSSAIPFIYPPECIDGEHYGDGAMQQLAPISPAVKLGADRVFIVGVGQSGSPVLPAQRATARPSLGQIGGHVLDSIFTDTLEMDLERLRRVNETVALIPFWCRTRNGPGWRSVDALVVQPSKSFADATARHAHHLPPAIRVLLRTIGAMREGRTNVLSYLLTEGHYCRSLMRQGYRDALARRSEICGFLGEESIPRRQPMAKRVRRTGAVAAAMTSLAVLPDAASVL